MTCGQVIVKDQSIYTHIFFFAQDWLFKQFSFFSFNVSYSSILGFAFFVVDFNRAKTPYILLWSWNSKDLISFRERNAAKFVNCLKYCIVHLVRTGLEYKHLLGCREICHYSSLKIMQQRVDSLAAC